MAQVVGRIRRHSSFRALARPDGRGASRGLSVSYRSRSEESDALGAPVVAYALGKRLGGAVARNRLRRRLRAAVRTAGPDLPRGAYLVRAEPSAARLAFSDLEAAVRDAALHAAEAPAGPGSPPRGAGPVAAGRRAGRAGDAGGPEGGAR